MVSRRDIPWTRGRRLVWWGSLVVVVGLAAAWGVGVVRLLHVAWKFGEFVPPRSGAAGDPEAGQWVFRARSASVMTFRGQLQLAHSEYRAPDPTREGLDRWSTWGGWDVINIPASSITSQGDPGTFLRGLGDWRVSAGFAGAAGVFIGGNKGEVVRVVEAPFWLLIGLGAAPGCFVWRRAARLAGRLRRGECVHCGYPRAGVVAAGGAGGVDVCTECGRSAR